MIAMDRLVVAAAFLCSAAAFLCSAAAARRALHEPLYPIQWTPPPPPQQFVDPPPVVSSVLFPSTPSPPAASASKNVVTAAVSASVAALFLLLFLALFLYWKRHSSSPDCRSFIGSHDGGERGEGRNPAANFLYLGIMDAGRRRSGDVNASPYRKLAKERAVEMHHPSPQLQPMPPLSATASRRGMAPPLVECYGGDGFRTPQRSATSASVSPCSWVSRMSLPSISSGGTEFLAASSLDPAGCRRFSCRMQLGNFSFSQVKQMIRPITLQPPPSPLPHPPPPPPPSGMKVVGKNEQHINDSMAPSAPSSERLSNPEPRESIRIGTSFPPGKNSNGIVSSDSRYDEKAAQEFENDDKPKLKPPHWHKPKAISNQAMAWDQLKSSSFEFNEDAIETLIVNNAASTLPKETSRIQGITFKQENIVLDLKKSQNITILLKALNVTREEVSEALQEGIPERLGSELLKALVQMAPTKEEEIKLRDYMGDLSKLGLAERFLKAVLDIPHAFKRVDAMLCRANFESEIKYLLKSFETLKAACEDLRTSRLFLELLEAVQRTESRINVGTHRGQAQVFKLDSLLKLADVIGTDGRTTLLHFVLQDIVRSERSSTEPTAENPSVEQFERECLEVVARLSNELDNVKKAAAMDLDVLISYVSKLEVGLQKIKSLLQLEKSCTHGVKFFEMMRIFHGEAEREIDRIKTKEKSVINLVKETTAYFHGDAANEDAHSLRIFVVVSGFLSVLDKERKEEGNLHERAEI